MDDIDRKLILLMEENPRMSLREISRRLEVSRQTVHHRLQALERIGVFKNLRASICGDYIDEFAVAIWGWSDSASVDSCLERLGKSKYTYRVEVLGGNCLFIMAGFIDISKLDSYVEFAKLAAEMPEPTIGIMSYNDGVNPFDKEKKQSYKELSQLDLAIIDSLKDNARRPAAEIGKVVGVSAKTAQRHLDDMMSEGSMVFDQPWNLTSGEDMLMLLFIKLRSGADKVRVAGRLLSIDLIHFNYIRSFSNIQGLLIGLVSCDKTNEIRKIVQRIAEDEDVLSVTPNLIYDECMYWDQDPRSPDIISHPSKKARKKDMRSGMKS